MRSEKDILIATKQFATENRLLSWWHVGSTIVVYAITVSVAAMPLWWPIRLVAAIATGLVMVRLFVLYHDYQHNAILAKSPLAKVLATLFGILALTPPSNWTQSHNTHHKKNSRLSAGSEGTIPLLTKQEYEALSFWKRCGYWLVRHPIVLALGYVTVFLYGMTIAPIFSDLKHHWDCLIALVVHVILAVILMLFAPWVMLFSFMIPIMIASAIGAYLFYAQHNFPGVKLASDNEWSHVFAALHSSSYIKMGWLMNWCTANIGYHHVHHLNSKIPFYRLPKAMAAIEELQSPTVTTLWPQDIIACLRLKLWDANQHRMIRFNEAWATSTQP